VCKALITGSGGLVGSESVRFFSDLGWRVIGIDNDMRREFFGPSGSTAETVDRIQAEYPDYCHLNIDIRDRDAVRKVIHDEHPDLIIHTAAQPSHDKAAYIPYDDFDVNAGGTLNLLVAARDFCPESPFCFTSTNKVYGDRPNQLPLVEKERRFDYADGRAGVDETMPVDQCLHSLFGASKLAADVLCQEFGRYFEMPVGIFRGGCLTGPQHAAVQLHGYLTFIAKCAVRGEPYRVIGYKGKQVRDQIHCRDVARLFFEFYKRPRAGEVYNLGGGRENSISILETIDLLAGMGYPLNWTYDDTPRTGDHICYITDLAKVQAHFPAWRPEYSIAHILEQIVSRQERARGAGTAASYI
jgi:CDP-paratose 2-epimerase